jgi:hypothetical protein
LKLAADPADPVTKTFREERERFRLRLHCEDCALWDEGAGCAHGFPTDEHRQPASDAVIAPVVFCKDFELA